MRVVNPMKEHTKVCLRNDIESSIANLTDVSSHIHETISAINRTVQGSTTGADQRMVDDCQKVLQDLTKALQNLYMCRSYISALDTSEREDDT